MAANSVRELETFAAASPAEPPETREGWVADG